jgi:hypothetical protein
MAARAEIDWEMVEMGLSAALRGVRERKAIAVRALLVVLLERVPWDEAIGHRASEGEGGKPNG